MYLWIAVLEGVPSVWNTKRTWSCSTSFLTISTVFGGLASISGALYGALFIQFVPNIADELSKAAPWAIFGILMILFVYLLPTGVAGGVRLLLARTGKKAHNHPAHLKEESP